MLLPLFIQGVQALFLLLAWSACLGFLIYHGAALLSLLLAKRKLALSAGPSLLALPAPSLQPASAPSAQTLGEAASLPTFSYEPLPLDDVLSDARVPTGMHWILRSPEFIAQNIRKTQAQPASLLTEADAAEDLLANPFEEPEEDRKAVSSAGEGRKQEVNILANPFELSEQDILPLDTPDPDDTDPAIPAYRVRILRSQAFFAQNAQIVSTRVVSHR